MQNLDARFICFNLAKSERILRIVDMKSTLLALLTFIFLGFTFSCDNQYRRNGTAVSNEAKSSDTSSLVGLSKDAYQVTEDEYDNYFVSRYGLLHQKFSDSPFTGRIVTISTAATGNYVASDESWRQGKKEGISTRWFSNGTKMYERNYSDGKWNGTVTRWWPNGQKMYVRAYSNGLKHGREATWRSDGTPIDLSAAKSQPTTVEKAPDQSAPNAPSDALPTIAFPEPSSPIVSEPASPVFTDPIPESISDAPSIAAEPESSLPELPGFTSDPTPAPIPVSTEPPVFEPVEPTPTFEPLTTDAPPVFEPLDAPAPEEAMPALPASDESLPPLPGFESTESPDLPAFPASDVDSEAMPPLPGFPDEPGLDTGGLPPLPGSTDDGAGLPPLPGMPELPADDSADLPPLPGFPAEATDDSPGLPPLPDFPE